jgi:hypothetical protein
MGGNHAEHRRVERGQEAVTTRSIAGLWRGEVRDFRRSLVANGWREFGTLCVFEKRFRSSCPELANRRARREIGGMALDLPETMMMASRADPVIFPAGTG